MRLQQELVAAKQQNAALGAELLEARMAQNQLQSYADDFRRTYSESRRLLHQMTALYEVSTSIGNTVDPDEVMTRTADGLRRLLPSDGVAIYLLDDTEGPARLRKFSAPPEIPEPPDSMPLGNASMGSCLSAHKVLVHGPTPFDGNAKHQFWTLALPLCAGSEQLGTLLIVRRGEQRFADEETHLAEMVSTQTSMALQNARLATTDGLTGLFNRRYFEQALAFECARARRSGRSVGLVMLDIDRFKRFNATFGHLAGDEVLRLVAGTLMAQLRRTDILARVGGEEFAAILPEDSQESVAKAAERLRRSVEQHPPLLFEGRHLPGVRACVGGASLASDALSPRELIKAADGALREAKRRGRNRSVVAGIDCGNNSA